MDKRPKGDLTGAIHRYLFNMDEETSEMYFTLKEQIPSWSLAETLRNAIKEKYKEVKTGDAL